MTFREVSLQQDTKASNRMIKPRIIKLKLIESQSQKVFREYNLDVQPVSAPVDHTFRFYEPPNSFFQIGVPHLPVLLAQDKLALITNPSMQLTQAASPNNIRAKELLLEGRTDDAMTCSETTMHVYSDDGYRTFLVATFRFEILARPIHYCKAKMGIAAHHSLHLPASHTEVARNVFFFSSNDKVCKIDSEG